MQVQPEETHTVFVREIKIDDYEKDTPDNTLVIAESSNIKFGTGAKVWEASVCLAKTLSYLQQEEIYDFRNKTVLEFGCGAGLLALFMGALGARVIATDLPIVQDLFMKNIKNNRNVVKNKVEFREYNWNEPLDIKEPIDYILVSEGFTTEEATGLVLKRTQEVLRRNKQTIAFASFKIKHHNLNEFEQRLDELQLDGQRLADSDVNPEYFDSRTAIYTIRSAK